MFVCALALLAFALGTALIVQACTCVMFAVLLQPGDVSATARGGRLSCTKVEILQARVQVGLPSSRETYVHRLGRTARAGNAGKGVLLLCDYERSFLEKTVKDLPIKRLNLGAMPAPGAVPWAEAVRL